MIYNKNLPLDFKTGSGLERLSIYSVAAESRSFIFSSLEIKMSETVSSLSGRVAWATGIYLYK